LHAVFFGDLYQVFDLMVVGGYTSGQRFDGACEPANALTDVPNNSSQAIKLFFCSHPYFSVVHKMRVGQTGVCPTGRVEKV
jgi:hypothetical protein